MDLQWWIVGALVVCALMLGVLSAAVKDIAREQRRAEKYRDTENEHLRENYWALRHEVYSAFESLGLKREESKPATGPTWRKPEAGPLQ